MSTRIGSGRPRRPMGGGRPRRRGPRPESGVRQPLPIPKKREQTLVELPQSLTVKELAEALSVAGGQIIKELIGRGLMVTINQTVDFATASDVAGVFNVLVRQKAQDASEGVIAAEIEEEE